MKSLKPALEAFRKATGRSEPNPVVRIQTEDGQPIYDAPEDAS